MSLTKEEQKLVLKIINKDETALLQFYKKYKNSLFNFVNKKLNNPEVSQEVVQDVFFDFIESLRSFQGRSSLKTFLFSIARYKVIDVIRKKKIKKILFSHLPHHVVEGLSTIILDDEIEKKELSEKIRTTFNKLPNEYGLVLRLKYINDVRVRQIAKELKLTFKAAESLLFRARRAFTKVFNDL